MSYLSATLLLRNLPPTKCLPLNHLTSGFGAVRLISASGLYLLPGPESGGPLSMFHDDGASTANTGTFVCSGKVYVSFDA